MSSNIQQPENIDEPEFGVAAPVDIEAESIEPVKEEQEPKRGNILSRAIERADGIDWRYKAQLTIGFCIAIIVPIYVFRDSILEIGKWGYLGAFLINGLSNATIILPAPGGIVIAILAQEFNPLLIGIAAGVGGAIGGSTAYMAGAINTASARKSRWFKIMDWLMQRYGGLIILAAATLPFLPGDVASLMAGGVRYPLRKYFLLNGIGGVIKMTAIAYAGAEALTWLETLLREWASVVVSGVFQF